MNGFTFKQQQLVNNQYKKCLAIINSHIVNDEIKELNTWIDKKITYTTHYLESKLSKTVEFTALTYALMGYREIAHQDYHNYLDKQIENVIHYSKEDLEGIYLEKYYEWIGL